MTRENAANRCTGETEGRRRVGCERRKRCRNNIDMVMQTQTSKTATRKWGGEQRTLESSKGTEFISLTRRIRSGRDNNH